MEKKKELESGKDWISILESKLNRHIRFKRGRDGGRERVGGGGVKGEKASGGGMCKI